MYDIMSVSEQEQATLAQGERRMTIMNEVHDIAIIGAGIIGSFLAHDLSKLECSILVLDKNADIADGASMANSAIVHAGHDPKDGTLKALLNVLGNRMYPEICRELGVNFMQTSAFVVSTCKEEDAVLEQLKKQASSRNIPFKELSGEEARAQEKNLSHAVTSVLEFPTTGIIYPWEVAIALLEEAVLNGIRLCLNEEVTKITKTEHFVITTMSPTKEQNTYEAKYVLNAAGVYADDIYQMILGNNKKGPFHITPKRGEYYVLDQLKEPLVHRVIYPVPGPNGKGVLVVPTTHGNYLLGPNSQVIEDKEGINTTADALTYVKENVKKTVENIPFDKVIRTFAGIRPTEENRDFIIEESNEVNGFVNVACIDSPGLASAPAISEYVIEQVMQDKFTWQTKQEYTHRKKNICLKELTDEEKNELVKTRPEYGEIVCRCEQVSKGEIIDSIRNVVGAKSVKGVKKRVRPGMGRCQGGFCEPHVVEILAAELGISPLEVRLDSSESYLLLDSMKGGMNDEGI